MQLANSNMSWIGLIIINLLLLLFTRQLLAWVYNYSKSATGNPISKEAFDRKVIIFRAFNALCIVVVGVYVLDLLASSQQQSQFLLVRLLSVLVTGYIAFLMMQIGQYLWLQRYGRVRKVDGKNVRVETYQSRMLTLFSSTMIGILALLVIIRLLGFDDLLQAGGIIGFMGVMLALTQSTWAPDIFGGLILLNSNMLTEGDIIKIHDTEMLYAEVFKTKLFHTVLIDRINNHRIMIRNAKLRDYTIHNLSRLGGAKGLKESLSFKIGYDVSPTQVREFFDKVHTKIADSPLIASNQQIELEDMIELQHALEYGIVDTGDHAVEWKMFYYTKAFKYLPRIRFAMMELCLETANEMGISLSTPVTHSAAIKKAH